MVYIDPDVEFISISRLRKEVLNQSVLKSNKVFVIQDTSGRESISVLMPYANYMELQEMLELIPVNNKTKVASTGK